MTTQAKIMLRSFDMTRAARKTGAEGRATRFWGR